MGSCFHRNDRAGVHCSAKETKLELHNKIFLFFHLQIIKKFVAANSIMLKALAHLLYLEGLVLGGMEKFLQVSTV